MDRYRSTVTADAARNVIWMTQEGHADAPDMVRMRDQYEAALRSVRPGFVLVNDQSGVQSFSDAALEVGMELVAMTSAAGASKVIRVVPDSLAQRSRISRVLVGGGFRYENVRVATRAEAEALLRDLEASASS